MNFKETLKLLWLCFRGRVHISGKVQTLVSPGDGKKRVRNG